MGTTPKLSKKKMSILWSLNPVVVLMKICGIPTNFELANKIGCTAHRVFFYYFWRILSFICLLLNCFFQNYNLVQEMKTVSVCSSFSFDYWKLIPFDFAELARVCLEPIYITGIPLVFSFQFYFTGKLQKIWNSILKFDEKLSLPSIFYRKCRKRCLLLIAISLLELTLFGTISPIVSSMIKSYNFGKLFNLGLADICNKTVTRAKIKMPPVYANVSLGTGIWVQSSVIAVLTLFCALVSITSLLAEELHKKRKEESFSTDDGDKLSFELDEWLTQFHEIRCLVESIQEFFSLILAFSMFYYFVHFPYQAFELLNYLSNRNLVNYRNFYYIFEEIISVILLFSLRLGTFVTVSNELKKKVEKLQNSLNRLPFSLVSSPKTDLQRENIELQISAQPEVKITACDLCFVDPTLILKLLGISLSYAYIVVVSVMSFEKE